MKDDLKRQQFEIDFRSFTKQLEVVLPDKAATPFLKDLKLLGKIAILAKNSFRDDHDIIVFVDEDKDGTVDWLNSVKEKYNIIFINILFK